MLTAAMHQERPTASGPTGDIDGEPPHHARRTPPSAPVPGHLIVIPKPRRTAALCAFSAISFITQRDAI
jgi:hypothetical protein